MPSQKIISYNKDYAKKLKLIRPFISFDYNLNKKLAPTQKAKISRYYESIAPYIAQGESTKVYRPRKKQNLKLAQNATGSPELKDIKVAFISDATDDTKIRIGKNKNVSISGKNKNHHFIPINIKKILSDNAREYLENLLSRYHYKYYSAQYGRFIGQPASKISIINEVLNRFGAYGHTQQFLTGLYGIEFTNQVGAQTYVERRNNAIKELMKKPKKSKKKK